MHWLNVILATEIGCINEPLSNVQTTDLHCIDSFSVKFVGMNRRNH